MFAQHQTQKLFDKLDWETEEWRHRREKMEGFNYWSTEEHMLPQKQGTQLFNYGRALHIIL